jgi:hypothetical protein
MSIETNFVPYQIALDMKLLGFDEPCILLYRGLDTQPVCQMGFEFKTEKNSDYNDETNYWLTVPTYSQAFKFFRDKHNLFSYIVRETGINHGKIKYIGVYYKITEKGYTPKNTCVSQDTYEEAELSCLIKLISLLSNK